MGWSAQCGKIPGVRVAGLFETIKFGERSNEKPIAGDGGSGHAHFVEGILTEKFVVGPGLENVGVAIFAERENFAVGRPGRGGEGGVARGADALFIEDDASRARIVAAQESKIEQDVKVIAIDKRGWIVGSGDGLLPGDALAVGFARGKGDVAGGSRFERENGADFVTDISGRDVEQSKFGEGRGDGDGGHAAAFPKGFAIEVVGTDAFCAGGDEFDALFILPDVRSGPVGFFVTVHAPKFATGFGVESQSE